MSLKNFALASNEKREQNIMKLRNGFYKREYYTIEGARKKMGGYTYKTVERWAKDGDIPLLNKHNEPVVPIHRENSPQWLWEWTHAQS